MALLLAALAPPRSLCRRGALCGRRASASPAARASPRAPQQRVTRPGVVGRASPASVARPPATVSAPLPAQPAQQPVDAGAEGDAEGSSGGFALALMSAALALGAGPASAYSPAVDTQEVTSVAQNAIGVLFTIAFAAFLLRVLNKRASRAVNVRVAAERKAAAAPPAELPPVTAGACFQGAGLAVLCAAAFWGLTTFVEGLFDAAAPSDQYAVRNVTGTLRSIVTGLGYLATFLFSANAIGLSGLGLQILTGGKEAQQGGTTTSAVEKDQESSS